MTEKVSKKDLFICFLVTSVTFMEFLDATILNTAIPKVAQSFGIDVLSLKASVTVYLISLAIFLPVSGWVAEKFGTRNTLVSAVALFTLSSLGCGLSQNLTQLIIGRIFQGMGASLMTPVSRLVIVSTISKERLQDVAGLVAIPITFGPLIGPILGGYIVTHYHWSLIFFINIPVGIVSSVLIWLFLKNSKNTSAPPFDLKGFLLAGTGLALLNFAVENNENPIFKSWMILLMILSGMAFLSGLVVYSRKVDNPVVDFGLFRYSTFRHGIMLIVLGFIVTGSITLIIAILLQNQFGLSPLASGLITFTTALGSVSVKPYIGRMVNKAGYKFVLLIYTLIMCLSIFAFCFVTSLTPHIVISLILFIYGITFSIHNNMINVIPYLEIEGLSEISRATSLVSTIQQFSMSLGVSFGILILDKVLAHYGIKEVHNILDPILGLKAFHITFCLLAILGVIIILLNSRFNYKKNEDFKEPSLSH